MRKSKKFKATSAQELLNIGPEDFEEMIDEVKEKSELININRVKYVANWSTLEILAIDCGIRITFAVSEISWFSLLVTLILTLIESLSLFIFKTLYKNV